ncbi:MAG TPA: hypothetical protein VFU47_16895, partial [Armatimonadota bacterium]|nr:hypothetical protein [Armatimonadota bacterium]
MEERTRPEQDPLLDTFRTAVIGGRWLLVIAATLESLLLAATGGVPPAGWTVLGCLLLYNLASLVLVHRLPVRRIPVLAILALDLLFVGAMASVTGGAQSPFLGQCYLIIYAGALFYGLSGGLTVGFVSALLATALTFQNPADVAWDSFRGYVPYFLIAGAFAGFLSE